MQPVLYHYCEHTPTDILYNLHSLTEECVVLFLKPNSAEKTPTQFSVWFFNYYSSTDYWITITPEHRIKLLYSCEVNREIFWLLLTVRCAFISCSQPDKNWVETELDYILVVKAASSSSLHNGCAMCKRCLECWKKVVLVSEEEVFPSQEDHQDDTVDQDVAALYERRVDHC